MATEPSVAALGGGSPLRTARRLLLATRPMFFTASVLPVLLGTAWGQRVSGRLDGDALLLALLAIVCVHGGVNVLNDVYDERSGTDRINMQRIYPYTGGSRFIQNRVMSLEGMQRWGVTLLGLSLLAGAALVALEGMPVLLFGLLGIALGILYSMPPIQLSARGLGETAVGIGFGVLPVTGAVWLQSGGVDAHTVLLALPVSFWVANILLINEVPDIAADGAAGKRTLPVRIGIGGTQRLYLSLNVLAVLAVAAAVGVGALPAAALVAPLLLMVPAAGAARAIAAAGGRDAWLPGIKLTLAIHAVGTLWIAGWAWMG
ncbi:MAG: prenyltransferase [Gammaproteobacteria bacterium]|nr:prenyltransferase [Gammaproteobacteria bacterium]NIR85644.1 prenyltransferase [Gammaproteobacteria bacterium]NIR90132.1 prenyltransferase [Gammaproteobacteria bacterium]NIU06778.1 prenyltransferase [Gammaproteobacteria bacterium]NIV53711.1 prenyltransferase [Gammaproteobacteria bacterium]